MSYLDDVRSYLESREKEVLKKYVSLKDEDISGLLGSSQILRSGNGWLDESVDVHYLSFKPLQPSTIITICEKGKSKPFGFLIKPKREEVSITELYLGFIPYWWVNAIFYCFSLRKNTYEIPVESDVIGVIVDNRIRCVETKTGPLTVDKLSSEMYDEILSEKLKRLKISEAVEITFSKRKLSYVIGDKVPLESIEDQIKEYISKYSGKVYRVDSLDEVEDLGKDARKMNFNVSIEKASVSKKDLIKELQNRVSKLPNVYKILETFLEVYLTLVYIPIYRCELKHVDGRVKTLYINGVTGKTFK